MTIKQLLYSLILCATFLVYASGEVQNCRAADPQAVAALPRKSLPLPPRKALPPRDCWTCLGPPAPQPCLHTHSGYLYYGTYPWDDDPVNGFDDCPNGDCGYCGAGLTFAWIWLHPAHRERPVPGQMNGCCSGYSSVPNYLPQGKALSVPSPPAGVR